MLESSRALTTYQFTYTLNGRKQRARRPPKWCKRSARSCVGAKYKYRSAPRAYLTWVNSFASSVNLVPAATAVDAASSLPPHFPPPSFFPPTLVRRALREDITEGGGSPVHHPRGTICLLLYLMDSTADTQQWRSSRLYRRLQ